MEKMRNKNGQIISYREKVYVDGKAITRSFQRRVDALTWKMNFKVEAQKKKALGIEHIQSIEFNVFFQEWSEMKKNENMSTATMVSFSSVFETYLSPIIKKAKLEKINQSHWQQIVNLARKNGIKEVRINFILRILKQLIRDAIKLNHLVHSPILTIKKLAEPPRALNYWLPDQVRCFLNANKNNPHFLLFSFALNTGLRRGEILGLCWDKVDWDNRKIEIARTRGIYGFVNTTKTKKIRHVPLSDTALEILKALSRQKGDSQFVFLDKDGTAPCSISALSGSFKKGVANASLPWIRFHDLRTTYASNFVMAKGDIYALSKILGHSKVEMTASKYAALHPDYMKDIANTVEFSL